MPALVKKLTKKIFKKVLTISAQSALTILKKRAVDEDRNASARAAYNNAISIVTYALEENKECLSQFDY